MTALERATPLWHGQKQSRVQKVWLLRSGVISIQFGMLRCLVQDPVVERSCDAVASPYEFVAKNNLCIQTHNNRCDGQNLMKPLSEEWDSCYVILVKF
jgi:hypothetical protein